ncbi:hypothetical protein HII17_14245 [Thalassotalea sp. M1531]|uniref:Uncharacterized protein n=1 Tax=Thalassotalea algicola TaxID=2716224 RepID=A0A7Y0Q766_9GAMM|nr:hypothetical protein [Thalassotalea algicola]NMP32719.1 hypothetical protein [Thalassotalea algicola]
MKTSKQSTHCQPNSLHSDDIDFYSHQVIATQAMLLSLESTCDLHSLPDEEESDSYILGYN